MLGLSIENEKGARLRLTNNPNYTLYSVTGLNPPGASINTAINATFDGSTFKSSRLENRNVVIMLAVEGSVETNRTALYNLVKTKHPLTVYVTTSTRNVCIKGYVESMDVGFFNKKQVVQISVICPDPYLKNDVEIVEDFVSVQGLFFFPMDIPAEGIPFGYMVVNEEVNVKNLGDVSTGMIIEFRALGAVVDPIIYHRGLNQLIKININMADGDVIQINTNRGEKSVLLYHGGSITNILNLLNKQSTWLELEPGDNIMLFTATTNPEFLQCAVYHNYLYEGI